MRGHPTPQTIFFRIGNSDTITLSAFISGLRNFLGILEDVDSAVSQNSSGSMKWELTVLEKNSPPIVGVTPNPRRLTPDDVSFAIQSQVLENIHSLTSNGERTNFMPDAALLKLKNIARSTKRLGPSLAYVYGNGHRGREESITEATFKNVSELTDPKYSAYGSVVGKLESISVHRGNEFRVWDKNTGRPVRCLFSPERESDVKDHLRSLVLVAGIVKFNTAGLPISLEMEELEKYAARDLPSIGDMSGLVDDFTGGRTLKEYLEDTADE
jgi:hypothetical protein